MNNKFSFGLTSSTPATTGGGLFGINTQQTQQNASIFGTPIQNQNQTTSAQTTVGGFGGGAFSFNKPATTTASPFSQATTTQTNTPSLFGAAPTTQQTGNLFGSPAQPQQTLSLFGQQQPAATQSSGLGSSFSFNKPATTTGSPFGQPTSTTSATTQPSLFSSLAKPATTTGTTFSFGVTQPTATQPTSTGFGTTTAAQPTTQSTSSFGGLGLSLGGTSTNTTTSTGSIFGGLGQTMQNTNLSGQPGQLQISGKIFILECYFENFFHLLFGYWIKSKNVL